MQKVKVENMKSNNGNNVPNQFIIITTDGRYFQSYKSIIAYCDNNGRVTLGKDWDYSVTTGKYRNQFLGETKKETQHKLDDGTYWFDSEL